MAVSFCQIILSQTLFASFTLGISLVKPHANSSNVDVDMAHLHHGASRQPDVSRPRHSLPVALVATGQVLGTRDLTEDMYQQMAALQNDNGMIEFAKLLLKSENKFVPLEREDKLAEVVPWFSGTKGIRSLAELRKHLLSQNWVIDLPAPAAIPESEDRTHTNTNAQLGGLHSEASAAPLPPAASARKSSSDVKVEFTEAQYQGIANSRNDAAMSAFIKGMLASESKFIPLEEEGRLAGLVPWFSGTKGTQSFVELRRELLSKSWVKDLQAILAAPEVTEAQYQEVVALRSDVAMSAFAQNALAKEKWFIAQADEGHLAGFIPWYSGTRAAQNLAQMVYELISMDWTQDKRALFDAPEVTEAQYREMAALHNDVAMIAFAKKLLASENRFIAQEDESRLAGLVPWFSGTKATQSLDQLRKELFGKAWVKQTEETGAAPEASVVAPRRSPAPGAPRTGAPATRSGFMNATAAGSMHAPFAYSATSTCAECFVQGFSRVLSFNAFRTRIAESPNRQELFHDEKKWKRDGMFESKEGTYWLVRSPSVQIQARYVVNESHSEHANFDAMAVSGPFVGGNRLLIRPLGGKVTWNQQSILNMMPSNFSNAFVSARYTQHAEFIKLGGKGPGLEFVFTNGLFLAVNRFTSALAVRIHMCEGHGGVGRQSGQCGTLDQLPFGDSLRVKEKAISMLQSFSFS